MTDAPTRPAADLPDAAAVRWAWLFLDTPRVDVERSWAFWAEVTGQQVSDRRGEADEFATLAPEHGEPWLKLQAVDAGRGGVHLDLDVEDVRVAADRAEALGAQRVGAVGDAVVVLRSPGGFVHCLTTWDGEAGRAGQVREGLSSLLDQVCLDVPSARWEAENAYWEALTGWTWRASDEPGYASVSAGAAMPVRILLQTLGEEEGEVRGHVDLACSDRPAAVARHVAAGAVVLEERAFWTVLLDPVGRVHCLTDRPVSPAR